MPVSRRAVARATELAFEGRFTESLAGLEADHSEQALWVRAYVAASRGEFDGARALATALATSARARPVRVASAITHASVLRQAGHHARAEASDRAALDEARSEIERAHALIGLAADAIGRGRVSACESRLAEVDALDAVDWRVQVRKDWVRVERALAIGRPADGLGPGRRAVRRSHEAGARRHLAKSRLFYGVALADASYPTAAHRELAAALRGARACGARPIANVARTVLEQKAFPAAG